MPKAKWAAQKALELDDTLGDAHASLATVRSLYDFDRPGAEKEFRRALELRPSSADAHLLYGQHLAGMGRFDEAVSEVEQAQKLDAVSPAMNAYIALPLILAHRYDEAIRRLQPIAEIYQNYHHPHVFLGLAYEQKGEWAKAIAEMEKAYELDKEPEALAQLGHVYAVSGRTADARKVLRQLKELSRQRYVWARREGMVAFAGYPLSVSDKVLGVIAVFGRKPFEAATLQTFAALSVQLASFIRRRHAEERLLEAKEAAEASARSAKQVMERLDLALRASGTGIWTWDTVSNVVIWDAKTHELFGILPEGFGGAFEEFAALIHQEDRDATLLQIQQCTPQKPEYGAEFRVTWPDSSVHHLDARGLAFHDPAGLLVRMTGSILPTTTLEIRKAAERAAGLTQQLLAFSRQQVLQPSILNLAGILADMDHMIHRVLGAEVDVATKAGENLALVKIDRLNR